MLLNEQGNGERLIYRISYLPPRGAISERSTSSLLLSGDEATKRPTLVVCRLFNGFHLYKDVRSDEKLRYTESEIRSIVRTVFFTYAFERRPTASILETINNTVHPWEQVAPNGIATVQRREIGIGEAIRMLDTVFGANFSHVTRHSVLRVFNEYQRVWRYYPYGGGKLRRPSARDYVHLYRFANAVHDSYSRATLFVNTDRRQQHPRRRSQQRDEEEAAMIDASGTVRKLLRKPRSRAAAQTAIVRA